jgi:Right handed beta helix region
MKNLRFIKRLYLCALLFSLSAWQQKLGNVSIQANAPGQVVSQLRVASNIYYVAPNGNDSNGGTMSSPFLTVQKAQSVVVAGDTVYIRGGSYIILPTQIVFDTGLYACVTKLDKSGTSSARITYLAYPNEKPVFDFSQVKPSGRRITAFFVTGSYISIVGIEVIGVQVTMTTHTQSECFRNEGSYNTYENLKMHDGMGIGFYLTKGGHNLILNCDAYNNWDNVSENKLGGNTDGFGCHPNKQGVGYDGNVFRGCRAWFNSDDGYDCINAHEATTFENCWAFYNGYSSSFQPLGDGNGFKAGGYGAKLTPSVPTTIPRNIIRFCLAVNNKVNGFYANHHLGGCDWYNNTAYKNGTNYNMLNRKSDFTADVAGYEHTLKNNLDVSARSTTFSNINTSLCTLSNNSWQLSSTVSSADFVNISESLLTQGRNSDWTLPSNDFLRLVSGSALIDGGVNLGFAYKGAKPDLGCFEF